MSVGGLNNRLVFGCRFDETSGTSIANWKGANTGTLTGGTLNQAGPGSNKAILLNGSSDFIEFLNATVGSQIALGILDFSISVWFKTTSTNTQFLFSKSVNGANARYQATTFDNSGTVVGQVKTVESNNTYTVSKNGSGPVNNNAWHMLTMIRQVEIDRLTIYTDTSPLFVGGLGVGSNYDNTGSLLFGKQAGGTPSYFTGSLALPYIWSQRALSQANITELYNSGNGLDLSIGTKVTCDFNLTGAATGFWDVFYQDAGGNDTLAGAFEVTQGANPQPTPEDLPGVTSSVPSDSIKHILNAGRYQGSIVLDTTGETGKTRLTSVASLRDTFLTMFKATSKRDIHLNTSAGNKLKAIAALNPNTATAADIINAAKGA